MESMAVREVEPAPDLPLDKGAILDKLFDRVSDTWGIDLEELDVARLLGDNDNDFLKNLISLAVMEDIDPNTFLIHLGVPREMRLNLGLKQSKLEETPLV